METAEEVKGMLSFRRILARLAVAVTARQSVFVNQYDMGLAIGPCTDAVSRTF